MYTHTFSFNFVRFQVQKYLYVFISNLETDGLSDLQYTSEVGGQVAVTQIHKNITLQKAKGTKEDH
jgi:hypothetical protein